MSATALRDVLGHRAGLRVRHEPARTEHAARLADRGHHVGGRDGGVEVDLAAHDLLDELLATDDVGAGLGGLARLLADGEDADAHGAAGAVGQRDGAPKRLVGLARVDAETERELDGLVELRVGLTLEDLDRVDGHVLVLAVVRVDAVAVALAVLVVVMRRTSTPMLRAVPSMMRIAFSMSFALRSAIFFSAISRTCAWLSLATFSRFGSPEPFSTPAACLISSAAGGCFVTNVNERSS